MPARAKSKKRACFDYAKQQPSCIMAVMDFSGKVSHFAVVIKNPNTSFALITDYVI